MNRIDHRQGRAGKHMRKSRKIKKTGREGGIRSGPGGSRWGGWAVGGVKVREGRGEEEGWGGDEVCHRRGCGHGGKSSSRGGGIKKWCVSI